MFNAQKMDVFSRRTKAYVESLQGLREEAVRLDAIYTNETASGSDEAFADTTIADEAEHVEGIVLMRAVESLLAQHVARMTPFLQ